MFNAIKSQGLARLGIYTTSHGEIETPAFMNVGTQAAIKGALSTEDLERIGCQVLLCNTYHLHLRPGDSLVHDMGGIHGFAVWNRPVLTDSGGFQVFSLAKLRNITEEGVTFNAHTDRHRVFMGPEESMRIQWNLGSDIAMAFDECIENPSPYDYVERSCARTVRWLERCKAAMEELKKREDTINPHQDLWGINQGGTYPDIRIDHMKRISELDLPGYAIGGLAVGESTEVMYDIIERVTPEMPFDKPRYLMGVGTPVNIIEAVARGVDIFDCVMPARNARHGHIFTSKGIINMNNAKYASDEGPIDEQCSCPACRRYSRAYIRHLMRSGEMLGMRLAVMHNLYFYNNLMAEIRQSLKDGTFEEIRKEKTEVLARRI